MARITRFKIAKPDIEKYFNELPTKILAKKELSEILSKNITYWRLAPNFTTKKFIESLLKESYLKEIRIYCPNYDITSIKYIWNSIPSIYQIALSIKPRTYLSHYTAMFLHNLTLQIPKKIYVNSEQSKKIFKPNLEQNKIDLAFKNKDKVSNYIFDFENWNIVLISGKNTSNLGVEEISISQSEKVFVTSIERTLIDITVRPIYSGGIYEVLNAYKEAKGKFSVNKMLAILKQINHAYPYHQAIGFYMEKAGYRKSQLDLIRKLEMQYDFYLERNMKEMSYSKEWKLFFPKNF